ALYKAYLLDPDLQDARARWPFICMWDNHEFSWKGWQTQQNFGAGLLPAQTRKIAAAQTWFEYQPARVSKPGGPQLDRFAPPKVADAPIHDFDDHGLGQEPGNLAAIGSLKLFRSLRWGRNVDLILTDNRTYRSEPVMDKPEAAAFNVKGVPYFIPQDVVEILDGGRDYNGGKPPDTIRFNGGEIANFRKSGGMQTILGIAQKAWFLDRLRASAAPWKIWGNSIGMLDWRVDFQNLPADLGQSWPTTGYGIPGDDDFSGYLSERASILDFNRKEKITGFVTVAGDRHSFLAGVLSPWLPPKSFEPVGAEFVTGSISAPGLVEAMEHNVAKDHPLRAIYLYQPSPEARAQPAINFSMMHGVRASLALQRTHDLKKAVGETNPEVGPHLSFADCGGHGYSVVRASSDELEVEFVCIPRPIEPNQQGDGGPLAYRVAHRVKRWLPGSVPRLERIKAEGRLPLVS